MRQLRRFLKSRSGATAVEYALIAALISVVIISGATLVGQAIAGKYDSVATSVAAVPPT